MMESRRKPDPYPRARSFLITAGGGGSNGPRTGLRGWDPQRRAEASGLTITVAHFPPDTSKWDKIAHRLFSYIPDIRKRFRWLLGLHEKDTVRKARAMCADMIMYSEGMWAFARVPDVEPMNNLAERTLRKAVLWRKGSNGSMSAAGSRFAERMFTVCESLRAQGRNVLDFLEETNRAVLCGQPLPSLPPARAS